MKQDFSNRRDNFNMEISITNIVLEMTVFSKKASHEIEKTFITQPKYIF